MLISGTMHLRERMIKKRMNELTKTSFGVNLEFNIHGLLICLLEQPFLKPK